MQPRFPGSPVGSRLLENITNCFAVETRLSVFFQVVLTAISRFQSTEENFQLKAQAIQECQETTLSSIWKSFSPSHCRKGVETCNGSVIRNHLRRVGFYTDMSKQCLGDILQINQMAESPDQLWTIPSCLPIHSMTQTSIYSRNEII